MTGYGWAGLCLGLMTGLYLLYQAEKYRENRNKRKELALKGGATLTAALLAGYGCFVKPCPAHFLLLAGLCVCAAADVILDMHFLAGTAAFALGHVCYCAAYLAGNKPGIASLVVFLLLAGTAIVLYPQCKRLAGEGSALPYLGYALLLSVMLSLALPQKPLLLLGAALFVISDGMLLFRIVRKIPSKGYDYACLGAYYLAQFLIAASTVL